MDLLRRLTETSRSLKIFEDRIKDIRHRYDVERRAYEKCDLELAKLDGRLKKYPPGHKIQKAPDLTSLTTEQIKEIAQQMGVIL